MDERLPSIPAIELGFACDLEASGYSLSFLTVT